MTPQQSLAKELIPHLERCRKLLVWCAEGGRLRRQAKFHHLHVNCLIQLKSHSLEVLENTRDKDVGKSR